MEVAAANRNPIIKGIQEYMLATKTSIAALAKDINYSRTTVSRYLAGKYDSNTSEIEGLLSAYLADKSGTVLELPGPAPLAKENRKPIFFESRDAKSILGVCQSCQEYADLGLVVGRSGFGKTYTLKQYAKLPRVAYVVGDDAMGGRDLVRIIENALKLPRSYGSVSERADRIKEFFNVNKGYLLIIDEADKLISKNTLKKMGIVQAIFDQSDVGIVLAGEPALEVIIKTYFTRLANRITFCARPKGLSPAEVERYLDDFQVDANALDELKSRACNPRSGCFRLFDRTLSNVSRILMDSDEAVVTGKVIAQASSMMMM